MYKSKKTKLKHRMRQLAYLCHQKRRINKENMESKSNYENIACQSSHDSITDSDYQPTPVKRVLQTVLTSGCIMEDDVENVSPEMNCIQCEELPALWKCEECDICLCDKCKKGHVKIPLCQHHKTTRLVKHEKDVIEKKSPRCQKHNELITLNCTTCEEMICTSCQQNGHTKHSVEDLGKAFDKLLQQFQTNGEQVDDNLLVLHEKIKQIEINIDNTAKSYQSCRENVELRAQEIIKTVNEDKADLIAMLDKRQLEETHKLETLKEEIQCDIKGCMHVKCIIDSKRATLMSSMGTDLRCEDDSDELKALELDKVTLNNPNFTPADIDPGQVPLNRVGTIEFHDVVVKFKPHVRKNGPTLPETVTKKMQFEKDILIPSGSSFHFGIVDTDLWVPIHCEDTILVYSNAGEKKRHINVSRSNDTVWGVKSTRTWQNGISSKSISAPRALRKIGEDSVLVASDSGIDIMDVDGKIKAHIEDGEFCDVSFNEETEKFCALDYSKKKCSIFKQTTNGDWIKEEEFMPRKCKVDQYGSVLLTPDSVVICPGATHVVQKYSIDGETMQEFGSYGRGEPGQLWGPSLCSIDHQDNILIADVNNKRLQVLDKNNKWLVVYIEGLSYPFDIKMTNNGIWALHQHSGTKYKLSKYVYEK